MFERGFGPIRELTELGLTSYERFQEALAGTGLGVGHREALGALSYSGGAAGGLEAAILEGLPKHAAWAGEEAARLFAALDRSGDAEGRFITGPSLRLLGEVGPEHVLNVDSEPSVRALREGLRPIVREVFREVIGEERGRGAPPVTVNIDARGAFLPDGRSLEQLALAA